MRVRLLHMSPLALAAALAAPALGQAKVSSAIQKVGATEKISAANLTVEQALAKPDTTILVGKDGKDFTVGQLRRLSLHREQRLAALKGRVPSLTGGGGNGKTRFAEGLSRAAALNKTVLDEANAANTLHASRVASKPAASVSAKAKISIPQPGLYEVNRKAVGGIVSPGKPVALLGRGFGDAMGQANAIGQFPGGAVSLRVVDWHDDQVDALFPPDVRGVLDQSVTLQVVTSAGKIFKLDGVRFYAAREEVTLTHNIARMIRFASANPGTVIGDDGNVFRFTSGESINCFQPAGDTLTTVDPGRGFVVTGLGAQWGRTDAGDGDEYGDGGSRTFFPGYSFGDWNGDSIRVNWGVWRSHTSPNFLLSGSDTCISSYQIAVTVSGPAGVSPF